MNAQHRASRTRATILWSSIALAATLSACGGGYGGGDNYMPPTTPPVTALPVAASTFAVSSLVSDSASGAAHSDARLLNTWGIAFNPNGFVWVGNNGSNSSTLYDGNGVPQSLVVSTPAAPTGIVFNSSSDFKVSLNGVSAASPFIFSTEGGAIAAWSPSVSLNNAIQVVDGGAGKAVYKGLAIASYNGANYIYASDFHNGRVDVFDASFNKVTLPGSFMPPSLPASYAPFGIQALGGKIYLSFAQRGAAGDDDVHAAGAGIVDVFDTAGNFLKRLVSGGALNAPWGLAMAPANFGAVSGKLLVANFGDGKINAYDPETGAAAGALGDAAGKALVIDGLWGIAFGNGLNSQPANTLFFTAGPADETHGQYGRIDVK
ncbi:TIGR03118 family protein [Oxalobacteraceae bacterium]|nr:TIGR03118 family protein [Oxalobacteraceae bacterium]